MQVAHLTKVSGPTSGWMCPDGQLRGGAGMVAVTKALLCADFLGLPDCVTSHAPSAEYPFLGDTLPCVALLLWAV